MMNAFGHHNVEFTLESSAGIGLLRLLPNYEGPHPVPHLNRLLPGRLHRPKRMAGSSTAVQTASASALLVLSP